MTYTLPIEKNFINTGYFICDETRHLRSKASHTLVKVGESLPDILMVFKNVMRVVVANLKCSVFTINLFLRFQV